MERKEERGLRELKEMVWLTEEDYFNIMGWWKHSIEMAEEGSRGPIRDSERDTIDKIGKVKRKFDVRKK